MLKSDDPTTTTPEARRLPAPERHTGITPLDLRRQKFKSAAMGGFNRADVTAFMQEAADGFDAALRENERLRQEIGRLEAALNQHREVEGSLRNTLMSAQKVADDMRESAQADAERIVRDAETRADLMTQKAQARLEDVQREIDGLRMRRRESELGVESIIAALRHTLEFIREQEQRDRQERTPTVIQHRPRLEASMPVAAPAPQSATA
jgi:cell division initiation protein